MPIQTALWTVGDKPQELRVATLSSEKLLEEMIVSAPRILSEEWMLIGRQVSTTHGGIVDLVAIAPDGSLVLVELKRERTPRDVVAQALDYAAWVETLKPQEISSLYYKFAGGKDLSKDFSSRFGIALAEDSLNGNHQIIIVASALDAGTERIVKYLNARDVPINVLFFQIFENGTEQILSRAWLIDPVETQVNVQESGRYYSEPWNGEFYHSFGHGTERSWEDAIEFGFICAGGAPWYSRTLQLLSAGDRVWVKIPGAGFVGVCRVLGSAEPAKTFKVTTVHGLRPILEVAKRAGYHSDQVDDPTSGEYFVPVKWLQVVSLESAIHEVGMFGNQNSVCRPRTQGWRHTVDRLKVLFANHD